jgi:hypothetical protein
MIQFFVLGLLILINLYIIIYLFDYIQTEFDKRKLNRPYKVNLLLKVCEILVIMVSIYFVTQTYLHKFLKNDTIDYITIFLILFVLFIWVFINYINPIMKVEYGYSINNSNSKDYNLVYKNYDKSNNYNNSTKSKLNNNIFSKYVGSKHNNDYAFDNLYPNNIDNQINGISKAKSVKDKDPNYSAYNGYPPEHICHKCECLKKDDGSIFCGKKVPGMGTIGCSEKWECRNCKNCPNCEPNDNKCKKKYKATPDFKKGEKYECQNCKCYKTMAGNICGQRDMDGYIQKCRNICDSCSVCRTPLHMKFKDLNYIDVEPENTPNRDSVVVAELTNNGLKGIIEDDKPDVKNNNNETVMVYYDDL